MTHHVTKGCVFDDLGFSHDESDNLKIRAMLMQTIENELSRRSLTQAEAAKLLGVSQPRISDLQCGKLHKFTIDALIKMLIKLGKQVDIKVIDDKIAA